MADALTSEERDRYARDGYIVRPALFDTGELERLREESDRLVERVVRESLTLGERSPRLDGQRRDHRVSVRKLQPVADLSERFAALAQDERLLRPLRELLGCEPMVMEEKLNVKQPLARDDALDRLAVDAGEEGFEFHTDLAYFYLDGYPRETLSSAIAIDACTDDNGPLRVVPGSHLRTWPHREGWPPVLADGAVDEAEVVDLLVPAGTVMVFDSLLVHSSRANATPSPRRMMIYSHYPSTHDVEPDKRNRDLRRRGQEFEARAAAAGLDTSWSLSP